MDKLHCKSMAAVFSIIFCTTVFSMQCFADNWQVGDERYSDATTYLTEGTNAVYFYDIYSQRVLYLDEDVMEWFVLCDRPECDHTNDQLCNGYADNIISRIAEWNDRLYYVRTGLNYTYFLCSMKPDGSDHQSTELKIDTPNAYPSIHHGKVYFEQHYLDDNVEKITARSLNKPEIEEVVLTDPDNSTLLYFFSEHIYTISTNRVKRQIKISELNEETGETTTLLGKVSYGSQYYTENDLFQCVPGKGLIKTDFQTGRETVIWSTKEYGFDFISYCDGDFIYLVPNDWESFQRMEEKTFLVFDLEGELIKETELPEWSEPEKADNKKNLPELWAMNTYFGATKNFIFACSYNYPDYYIRKDSVQNNEDCNWETINYRRIE